MAPTTVGSRGGRKLLDPSVAPNRLPLQRPNRSRAVVACQDNLQFMKDIPDESVQLIVTSPPYNIGKDYEERTPVSAYLATQRDVIAECVRVLRPDGSICWQVGNYVENGGIIPLDVILYPIFCEYKLRLRNRIIWSFGHGLHCSRRLSGRYETINWWTKGDDYTWLFQIPSGYAT